MTRCSFIPCHDGHVLYAAIAPWLAIDPAPYALICGISSRITATGGWAGVIVRNAVPVVALAQTPPYPVVLAAPGGVDLEAVQVVAAALRDREDVVCGINGPSAWAEAVAAAVQATNCERMGVRLHRLDGAAVLPRPVAGHLRAFTVEEHGILARWEQAFIAEIEEAQAAAALDAAALAGMASITSVWTVDDRPVSMARRVRPLLGGWTIAGVYTPPELRGRGYAGAVVHGLSARLQAEGATYVALFTDLANPISNHLYAGIGFVPCLDQTRILWSHS